MTKEEIYAKYVEQMEKILIAQCDIDIARATMRANQRFCKHPDKYTYSAMGELGVKCPDCGYQT